MIAKVIFHYSIPLIIFCLKQNISSFNYWTWNINENKSTKATMKYIMFLGWGKYTHVQWKRKSIQPKLEVQCQKFIYISQVLWEHARTSSYMWNVPHNWFFLFLLFDCVILYAFHKTSWNSFVSFFKNMQFLY